MSVQTLLPNRHLLPKHVPSHSTRENVQADEDKGIPEEGEEQSNSSQKNEEPSRWVSIVAGKHKGKKLRFVKKTAQRIAVELDDGKLIYLLPDHVDTSAEDEISSGAAPNPTATSTPAPDKENAPRPVSPDRVEEGCLVSIVAGKYKGKELRFVKRTAQRIALQREDGKTIYLQPDHVDLNGLARTTNNRESPLEAPTNGANETMEDDDMFDFDFVSAASEADDDDDDDDDDDLSAFVSAQEILLPEPGDRVIIQHGAYAGKTATFIKQTARRVAVHLEDDPVDKIRYLMPSSLSHNPNISEAMEQNGNDPAVKALSNAIGGGYVINRTNARVNQTLFGAIFQEKALFLEICNLYSVAKLPEVLELPNSKRAFLVAIKYHQKERTLTCAFVEAGSNESIAEDLMKLGAFDKLNPRKATARLSLLLSKASSKALKDDQHPFRVHRMAASNFCMIPEHGNVGCGYIPIKMIQELLQDHEDVSSVIAIQVRVLIPSLGVFKGMLTAKPGIDRIELPPSMQKVKASVSSPDDSAILMINQDGTFPRLLRIQRQKNGFATGRSFPEMARWMMVQKGVSNSYLTHPNRYFETCIGIADATNELPPGTVFLTGIHNNLDLFSGDKILISRYPMTEASDGIILPLVKERPKSMSTQNWEFLCSMQFGAIVFSNPTPGGCALPECIAQGDLDGDEYFVCWDPNIVQDALIGDRPILAVKKNKSPPLNSASLSETKWWADIQEFMMDVELRTSSQRLIGALHDMWKKCLRENRQHDAVLFGRAFKQSIDVLKHGGKVDLAKQLVPNLPCNLRRFVRPME